MGLEAQPGNFPGALDRAGEADGVNGAPRSLVNTNGDLGFCSRWRRRSARNSSRRKQRFLTLRQIRLSAGGRHAQAFNLRNFRILDTHLSGAIDRASPGIAKGWPGRPAMARE
jgi:hypothetical protein